MNEKTKQSKKELECPHRCSYLLRLWRVDELKGFHWQASLETHETGERIGFGSLEELFAYLMDRTTINSL